MKNLLLHIAVVAVMLLHGCKEKEPQTYPEGTDDTPPTWITETQRSIKASENWQPTQLAEGCNPNLHISNLAAYELNYSRGFATIQLVPDTTSCAIEVSLRTDFADAEISKHGWDKLNFEFTYSEYDANSGSQLWLTLYYKDLELEIDLVPVIEKLIPADTTNGLIKLRFEGGEPYFTLNGKDFTPDFSAATGNRCTLGNTGSEQFFALRMTSEGVDLPSHVGFKFLRITRYGVKDA